MSKLTLVEPPAKSAVERLLTGEEAAAYRQLSQRLNALHCPASFSEKLLVQSLIDTEFRLARIPRIETGIAALDPTSVKYRSALRSLSLQRNHLNRMLKEDLAMLKKLKATRPEQPKQASLRPFLVVRKPS